MQAYELETKKFLNKIANMEYEIEQGLLGPI